MALPCQNNSKNDNEKSKFRDKLFCHKNGKNVQKEADMVSNANNS